MTFTVPDKYNRNAADVAELGPAADTGRALIEYMCQRIGVRTLEGLNVPDFGCGSRFVDAIVNRDIPVKSYVGIDVYGR